MIESTSNGYSGGDSEAPKQPQSRQEATRQLTYGEKAVGVTFNPSGSESVNKVKKLYAEIIDLICDYDRGNESTSEKNRLEQEAIRQAQTAQMWAVKAITLQ